jgi:hypothetical protein
MPAICEVVSGSERGGCKARHGSQTHRTKGDIFQGPRSVPDVQRCGVFRHRLTGSRRARYGPVLSASTMRSWKSLTSRVDDDMMIEVAGLRILQFDDDNVLLSIRGMLLVGRKQMMRQRARDMINSGQEQPRNAQFGQKERRRLQDLNLRGQRPMHGE